MRTTRERRKGGHLGGDRREVKERQGTSERGPPWKKIQRRKGTEKVGNADDIGQPVWRTNI